MIAAVRDPDLQLHSGTPRWQRIVLLVAGLQCLVWGVFIIVWPERSSRAYGFAQPPAELFLWQGTGLVIVLFGIGYGIASTNPSQHWLIVLIGLLSKSLGPIGMAWSVYQGDVSDRVLYLIPINDLADSIWLDSASGLPQSSVRDLKFFVRLAGFPADDTTLCQGQE